MRLIVCLCLLELLGLAAPAWAKEPKTQATVRQTTPGFRPIYAVVNGRPAMAVPVRGGGIQLLSLSFKTGRFEPHGGLMGRVLMGGLDVDYLSRAEFAREVRSQRKQIFLQRLGSLLRVGRDR